MELRTAIYEYVLGNVRSEDLPAIAVQALVDGYDSPALRQLAVSEGVNTYQLEGWFKWTLEELGIVPPSPVEAGLVKARSIAEEVVVGRITPYAGARQIWSEIYKRFPELDQLIPFVGLASEYEDREEHRDDYARDIVEQCRALLAE